MKSSSGGCATLIGLLLAGAILAAGIGAFMALRPTAEEVGERLRHQATMNQLAEKQEADLAGAKTLAIAVTVLGLAGGLILAAGGAGWFVAAELRKRAHLVHPNDHGIFPLVKVQVGGSVAIHDPNRQPTATVIYTGDQDGKVLVAPVVIQGLEDAQRAAIQQAAAIQLTRAAVSGAGLTETAQDAARRFFPNDDLPSVRIIGKPNATIDRLLLEGGESNGHDPGDG
jgi:hypothetical protein